MNTRLLKINAMKKFSRWMSMTGYGANAIDPYFMSVKEIDDIFDHQTEIHKRNKFCCDRKLGIVSYERWGHAERLLNYITKRNERKKNANAKKKR